MGWADGGGLGVAEFQRGQRWQWCGVHHHFASENRLFSDRFDGLWRVSLGVPIVASSAQS